MPPLDIKRYPFARLVVAEHTMPFRGRWFGVNEEHPGFERVDMQEGHTHFLIKGGSIVLVDEKEVLEAKARAAVAKAEAETAAS